MSSSINYRRLSVISILGFASGLPLALSGSTLQAWFTTAGLSIVAIGALSLVGQPYVYKFIWAPLLDRYVPPFFGRRRGWLIITQLTLIFAIIAMAMGDPSRNPYVLACLGLIVATLSATQDIAVDAYRTDSVSTAERGLAAALFIGGYRLAMLLSGGIALILAAKVGWRVTYLIMAGWLLLGLGASLFGKEPPTPSTASTTGSLWETVRNPLQEFLTRDAAWALLIFIVLYKIGDALSVALLTPFLLKGLGFSLITVGTVLKGVGLLASMTGAFLAGLLMVRLTLFRALLSFGILQILAIGGYLALALIGHNEAYLIIAIGLDYLANGMGNTALMAFLMSCCDSRYTAGQYALLSAISAVSRVFIGPVAGLLAKQISWPGFFCCAILISIPGLILLRSLKPVITKISTTPSPTL